MDGRHYTYMEDVSVSGWARLRLAAFAASFAALLASVAAMLVSVLAGTFFDAGPSRAIVIAISSVFACSSIVCGAAFRSLEKDLARSLDAELP